MAKAYPTQNSDQLEVTMSRRERDTIIAALRVYQHWLEGTKPDPAGIQEIATCGDLQHAMPATSVDTLCEELNI